MMIRRLLISSWLLAGGTGLPALYAQQGIQAAGGTGRGPGGTVSYSLGQVAYLTASVPGGTSTPGAQQPFELLVLGTKSNARIELESSTYPNPTTGLLTLRIDEKVTRQLTWHLQDLSGRQLLSGRVSGPDTTVPLTEFAAGTYLLVVRRAGQELKTFKILKH